jgi:MFS-type transporter involved in bile tolerance (Atg22 family)
MRAVPTLVADLGDRLSGFNGKSLWGYLNGLTTLCIVLCYVSLTVVADYGTLKRKLLVPLSLLGAACLAGFVFVFTPAAVALACAFFFVSQIARK